VKQATFAYVNLLESVPGANQY